MIARPIGPAPSTSAPSPGCMRRLVDRVHRHRDRLGERRGAGVEPVRHREAHRRGELHPLGERARVAVREAEQLEPRRRERHRHAHHEVAGPDREPVGVGTELEHLAAELVAHHVVGVGIERGLDAGHRRQREHRVRVPQRVEIGAADPARPDRHERLARRRHADPRRRRPPSALGGPPLLAWPRILWAIAATVKPARTGGCARASARRHRRRLARAGGARRRAPRARRRRGATSAPTPACSELISSDSTIDSSPSAIRSRVDVGADLARGLRERDARATSSVSRAATAGRAAGRSRRARARRAPAPRADARPRARRATVTIVPDALAHRQAVDRDPALLDQRAGVGVDRGLEQRLLAGEVGVDRGRRQVGVPGDVGDRRPPVPVGREALAPRAPGAAGGSGRPSCPASRSGSATPETVPADPR